MGAGVGGAVTIPIVGDALGSITEDLVNTGAVNWNDVATDTTMGAIFGPFGKRYRELVRKRAGQCS